MLCSGSFFLSAQTYNWQNYSTSNSPLPNNTIRTLLKGTGNDLWIGTDWGLCHFENNQWSIYNQENSPLSDNNVRTLCLDQSNHLWIGTTSQGIFVFDGVNWTQYAMFNSGLPSNFIRTIATDHQGHMWIGTVEGLVRFDGTEWTVWTIDNAGFFTNNISSIAVDANDTKIIGTINGGLLFYDNSSFEHLTLLEHGLPDNSTIDIAFDENGRPWYASPSGGLYFDSGDNDWVIYDEYNSPLTSNSLSAIVLDNYNNFFVGTTEWGLVRFKPPNSWVIYNTSNSSLVDDQILSLEMTNDGDIWVGTKIGGLHRLRDINSGFSSLKDNIFKIWPNPFADIIQIKLPNENNVQTITVYDLNGVVLEVTSTYENGQTHLHTDHFTPGIYFITIETNSFVEQVKLIKH